MFPARFRRTAGLLPSVLLIFGSASAHAAADKQVVNVFLLAGQSNMAGADSEVTVPPGFQQTPADRETRFTAAPLPDGENSPRYVPWGEIKGHEAKGELAHGPEVGFARALHRAGWRDVAIIKVYANFRRDAHIWPWGEGGELFAAWTKFVDARLAEVATEGRTTRICGFVWHQGIDDAIHGKFAGQYERNLSDLIGVLRKRYATERTPFLLARSVNSRIAQPNPDGEGTSPMAQVRRAQVNVAETVPYAAWIDVDDLPNVNTHHFSADSQLVIGQRFGEAFLKLQEKSELAPSPSRQVASDAVASSRPRARDLGIRFGVLPTGELNAITDVAGVHVGHRSMIKGDDVRTGVTAVLPHGGNIFQSKVPAAMDVANGFGKFVGATQIQELGVIETPILLTNTLSTFAVADALVAWSLRQKGNEDVLSVNPVVGECNDGYLNDIRGQHVRADDVLHALGDAKPGAVVEGCVGAGVGTRCLGWKGGIGNSSRKLPKSLGGYTVGVLVQTNFDGLLTIDGAPVGQELGRFYLKDADGGMEHGSCIVIVATDAPLDARQLNRLAKRATLGLAAVGSPMTHGSGDYVLAFSTSESVRQRFANNQAVETVTVLRDDRLSPLFQAVREATEEAVINSLLKATTTVGRDGHKVEAIDPNDVVRVCRKFGVMARPQSSTPKRDP
ncbi:MAG: P1 family peptidase, partial [Phycisphaerales bacterium]|nr:P1 family peptidase [Phycisphaerales bacterium]